MVPSAVSLMMKMDKIVSIQTCWSTPIWRSKLIEVMDRHDEIKSYIKSLMSIYESRLKSNRGGWQSPLIDPTSKPMDILSNELIDICKGLQLGITECVIPQMWANVNTKGTWNSIHQHGGSYELSAIYYVQVPENSGKLVFRDPRPGAVGNGLLSKNFDSGDYMSPDLYEGLLLIFPSYLDHFVEPSLSDEERISVSFDISTNWI